MDTVSVVIENWPKPDPFWTVCAVVVALLSIFLTFYFGWLQRAHFRKSAKPMIELSINTLSPKQMGYQIQSSGLRPAVLTRIRYSCGNLSTINPGSEGLKQFTESVFSEIGNISFMRWTWQPGTYISVGRETFLFSVVPTDSQSDLNRELIREKLLSISIELDFESVYGERDSVKFPRPDEEWERDTS